MGMALAKGEKVLEPAPSIHPPGPWGSRSTPGVCPGGREPLGALGSCRPSMGTLRSWPLPRPRPCGSVARCPLGAKPHDPSRWRLCPSKERCFLGRGREEQLCLRAALWPHLFLHVWLAARPHRGPPPAPGRLWAKPEGALLRSLGLRAPILMMGLRVGG